MATDSFRGHYRRARLATFSMTGATNQRANRPLARICDRRSGATIAGCPSR